MQYAVLIAVLIIRTSVEAAPKFVSLNHAKFFFSMWIEPSANANNVH